MFKLKDTDTAKPTRKDTATKNTKLRLPRYALACALAPTFSAYRTHATGMKSPRKPLTYRPRSDRESRARPVPPSAGGRRQTRTRTARPWGC